MIIDVREPAEFEICRIPGAVLIPLGSCRRGSASSTPTQEIVLHCKVRRAQRQRDGMLRARGFTRARNLTGGILAWIDQVDPSSPKY